MDTLLNERALHCFHVVAQQGGVRAGADHLGMDPATVSRAVTRLAEEAGAVLLERHGRGVRPTEAGELLLQHYRWLRMQQEDTLTRMEELKGMKWGTIDLALGEGFVEDLHDGALSTFCRQHPGVVVNQHVAGADDILRMVADGDVHLGLTYNLHPDPRVQSRGAWTQPLRLMVPPGHPLLGNPPVTLAQVAAHPIGLLQGVFGVRQLVDLAMERAQVRLVPQLTSNSFTALKAFVGAGLGVAFMPAFAARRAIQAGTMLPVALDDSQLAQAQAHIIIRRGRRLSACAGNLMECMARTMHAFGAEPAD
ncbi:MAG: LysR family transcriptional regulator [Holophaga sp.]|nr:LysR family transcriptional regulator [Holophaga sp.]